MEAGRRGRRKGAIAVWPGWCATFWRHAGQRRGTVATGFATDRWRRRQRLDVTACFSGVTRAFGASNRWQVFRRARSGQERTVERRAGAWPANSGHEQPPRVLHQRCVGCENRGRPWPVRARFAMYERWGNRRRRTRQIGAAAAIEWRAVRPEPQAVVRSTVPEAMARPAAFVRALLRGAVRRTVRGEAGTGEARSAPGRSRGDARSRRSRPGRARRGPRRALREAPARGGRGGPAGDAVDVAATVTGGSGGERSEPPGKRSAQRPKGAEARGIPARRGETAKRARQGSPVAKRRAQTHHTDKRERIHVRHHQEWRHRQHRLHRRVPDMLRKKSGGAGAERGAAGVARREGEPRWWCRGQCRPKRNGPRRHRPLPGMRARPVEALRVRPRRAGPECPSRSPCRRGCR